MISQKLRLGAAIVTGLASATILGYAHRDTLQKYASDIGLMPKSGVECVYDMGDTIKAQPSIQAFFDSYSDRNVISGTFELLSRANRGLDRVVKQYDDCPFDEQDVTTAVQETKTYKHIEGGLRFMARYGEQLADEYKDFINQ